MALFPTLRLEEPERLASHWRTLVRGLEGGEEQPRGKWLFPRRAYTLRAMGLSLAEGQALWDFYQRRSGGLEAFHFVSPISRSHLGEYVATGDGSRKIFTFPCKLAAGVAVYVAGAVQTSPTNYAFEPGAGTDGLDRLTFVAAPAAGAYVTADFSGPLVLRCRFGGDVLDQETLYSRIVTAGIILQGLRFDA